MTVVQPFFTDYVASPPSSYVTIGTGEMAQLGITAIFQARPLAVTPNALHQMERRVRTVLLLLDGRRTVYDVARLLHRREVEVAQVLVHLLKSGYIEYIGS